MIGIQLKIVREFFQGLVERGKNTLQFEINYLDLYSNFINTSPLTEFETVSRTKLCFHLRPAMFAIRAANGFQLNYHYILKAHILLQNKSY